MPRHYPHHRSPYRLTEIQYWRKEVWKLQYQKEVEVRMKSFGATRWMNPQNPRTKIKKKGIRRSTKRYIAWIAWLATGTQGEFGWWKYFRRGSGRPDAEECRHFQFVSWTSNEAASKSGTGFGKAQCIYAHSEGSELWNVLEDQTNKVFLQKTCQRSHAQSGKFRWLDYCRSQKSEWTKWISEQSSICRGGTRLGNPVVTVLLVQNKNFPEEPKKVPGADEETKNHLHWQFPGFWHVLRGIVLESLYVNTTQIRNKWDCWKSRSQGKRRDICGAIADWPG